MDELNKTAERNTELEARIGFMLSSRQVTQFTILQTLECILAFSSCDRCEKHDVTSVLF